jgi:hypothetical protein
MSRPPTIEQRLESLAIHDLPKPFGEKLAQVQRLCREMSEAARAIGVDRKFTPDGRFLGDIGEVIARVHFGIVLHPSQKKGEDGVCQVSGKTVEVKLRTSPSQIWVSSPTDLLVVIYLSTTTGKWGIVSNGPCSHLLADATQGETRLETTVSKVLAASATLPAGSPCLAPITVAP